MAAVALKGSSQKMPLVGFGLWKVTKTTCADTVYNAIKAGYRLFDGAGHHGKHSRVFCQSRPLSVAQSKLWNTFHSKEHVVTIAKKQLELWGIDYFDLFLIHFPISLKYVEPSHRYPPEWWNDEKGVDLDNTPVQETWTEMEKIHDAGLAKNIGISNFQASLILDLLRYARVPPAVLQIEHHPYLVQEPLVQFCKTHNIAITGYSSFGPLSYIELGVQKNVQPLLQHDVITQIAKKHGKTTAQTILRWTTQRGIAVIPKSNSHDRLVSNLDCLNFDLAEDEIKTISALDIGLRLNDPKDIDPRMAIFA